MSRRKQSKPQQVNSGEDPITSLAVESVPNLANEGKQVLRAAHLEETACLESAKERAIPLVRDLIQTQLKDVELVNGAADSDPLAESSTNNSKSVGGLDTKQSLNGNDETSEGTAMEPATHLLCENDRRYPYDNADLRDVHSGGFAPPPHSQLYPKFNTGLALATKRQEGEDVNVETNTTAHQLNDEDKVAEENHSAENNNKLALQKDNSVVTEEEANMYNCSRCDENFASLGDFVYHKKSACCELSPGDDRSEGKSKAMAQDDEGNRLHNVSSSDIPQQKSYVINSDVIMTDVNDGYPELATEKRDAEESFDEGSNGEHSEEDTEVDTSAGNIMLESLNGTRVAVSQTMAGVTDDAQSPDNEPYPSSPILSASREERATPVEQNEKEQPLTFADQYNDKEENENKDEKEEQQLNEAEKLQKEILAAEAMAQTIQSMTSFASQPNGLLDGEDKPEINAIKNQVRMIQQQQAYQIQMLNFLQWQLAMASSNPQAAMAAAAAASARSATMHNNFGMAPPFPPQLLPPSGNLGGAGLMPQMMAAMAMNNLQNGGPDLAELTKARLMMSMHQNASENAQNFRSLLSRSFPDQEGLMQRDQEQRYQLKEDRDLEGGEKEKGKKQERVEQEERECARSPDSVSHSEKCDQVSKSDSGYDEDGKPGSHGNIGNYADDTSSSHGSQEDGELRDQLLKSTAEEHRHRCRFCHKVFGSDSALQIHIRSHTGERPFKCNICGNRFTTKGNLKVHFMRHKSKYPHIPMNSQPVPEYLDHVPTSNGVPYGMSILPEKAVLERPRLHGNPSIHLNPHQAATNQRDGHPHGLPNLFMHHLNGGNSEPMMRPELPSGMGSADVATAIHAQLLQRRREELLAMQWNSEDTKPSGSANDISENSATKNPMSMFQAAMLPFLPGLAARQQLENLPPHLRYLLPHHLQALHSQQNAQNDRNENNNNLAAQLLADSDISKSGSGSERREDLDESGHNDIDKMAAPTLAPRPTLTPSSETSKLQRLVENIDRGRILQKNECHICHRVLSCQSALKLHYRTHTGERPYKCDLCSRAFTTRGNLRTHYSSVHRQQMRTIPPGGNNTSRTSPPGSLPCPLCPARFREAVEFQHHMQMHAMVQAQQQQRLAIEQEKNTPTPPAVDLSAGLKAGEEEMAKEAVVKTERDEEGSSHSLKNEEAEISRDRDTPFKMENTEPEGTESGENHNGATGEAISANGFNVAEDARSENSGTQKGDEDAPLAMDLSSPTDNQEKDQQRTTPPPPTNPLDSLTALSNLSAGSMVTNHAGSMMDHQMAALSRARAGRLTICEICEKPFSCQSALEIHLRTHTKERPFMCRICQRTFTTKGNLKQHLLTHNITDIPEEMLQPINSPTGYDNSASNSPATSPPPHAQSVPFIQKRAADVADLSSAPPQKRSFPRHWCHICQKQFSSASSLQIHNRTHTGEKPFACSVCGRAFTTKGNLKVHMGTHVWGAGGSRRGRRISMDNPLISPWMKNMRPRGSQPGIPLPALPNGHVTDPTTLYQQYAAIASGLLNAKPDASRLMLPVTNGHPSSANNSASSPASSSGSPLPSGEVTSPQNRTNNGIPHASMSAATEWFLKAYQRTQEQVN